ncbi:MAG: diguanylate cyclase [Phormidesmis sp.]
MLLRENLYFAILCLTTVISGCVALMAWVRRAEAPATRPFTWLMWAIAAYATAGALSTASTSATDIVFWAKTEAILSSAVTTLFFIFTLHFSYRSRWLTWWRLCLVWSLPVFNIVLVLTNPWHQTVWSAFLPIANSPLLMFQNGFGYLWLAAWFYIYVITGTLLVLRSVTKREKLYQQQAIIVVISAAPPLLIGILYVLELVPPGISLLPMSFLFTGIVYFTSLFRFRLFDLRPIARDMLIESMADSVLVLDNDDRVIDMNPAAVQFTYRMATMPEDRARLAETPGEVPNAMLTAMPNAMLGQPIHQVLDKWPSLLLHCKKNENTEVLVSLCQEVPLHINMRVQFLYDSHYRTTGKLLVIRDVTEMYQTQLMLEKTKKIQHQTQLELKRTSDLLAQRLQTIESLQGQLREQAVRDSLTQLFNRRYFEEALLAEWEKAKRARLPLAIILLDFDCFKRVNDTYGHQAGDCALQVFANVMRQHVRTSDIACRYGGEEFILALPGMTLADAYQRADALRRAFKETVIQYKEQTIRATVSAGVGAFPEWAGSPDELISLVDIALYRAKRQGRDRVCRIQLDNLPAAPPVRLINPSQA